MLEIPRRKLLGMTMAVFGFFYDVIIFLVLLDGNFPESSKNNN
jgi:hypothetical protein